MWSDVIVPGAIGILTLLLSEFFLPFVFSDTPLGKRQRHFYSILLTIFSLAMTSTVKLSLDTRQKIISVEKVFTFIADSHMKQHFETIFASYHRHFRQSDPSSLLEPWVNHAIVSLSKEMDRISVTLPSSEAKDKVFDLYESANNYIVATHVGPLDQYRGSERYREANEEASKRGIPIIRFYLFDGVLNPVPELGPSEFGDADVRNTLTKDFVQAGVTLDEYVKEVGDLHSDMKTLMSVVIPPDKWAPYKRRHFLLIDGHILAETILGDHTVRATGEIDTLQKAQNFLLELMGTTVNTEHVYYLDNEKVKRRFGRYIRVDHTTNGSADDEPLAKTLARRLVSNEVGK